MQYNISPYLGNYGPYIFKFKKKSNYITGKSKHISDFCLNYGEYVFIKKKGGYLRYNQKGKKKYCKELPTHYSDYDYKKFRWGICFDRNVILLKKDSGRTFKLSKYDSIKGHVIIFYKDNIKYEVDMRTYKKAKVEVITIPLSQKNIIKYGSITPVNSKKLFILFLIFKKIGLPKFLIYFIINSVFC